jgi:hypothetical protein
MVVFYDVHRKHENGSYRKGDRAMVFPTDLIKEIEYTEFGR